MSARISSPAFSMDPTLSQSSQQNLETRQILARVGADLFGESPAATGRYEIRGKLGAGGMGVVYEAYDPLLDCSVALKQMHAHLVDQPNLLGRLQAEARAMAKLRAEPHVVTLYDYFAQRDVFVVMELVRGTTLAAWQHEPHSLAEVLEMYQQAGRGLAAAHRAGLVHRDFKPDNVLIDARGFAKVSDFGLAREVTVPPIPPDRALEATDPDGPGATRRSSRSSSVVGTPRYIAPEVLREEPPEHHSDQFAFCVALWEALFHEHPFFPIVERGSLAPTLSSPEAASPHAYMLAIVSGELRPVPGGTPVPSHVRAALVRGLAREPHLRFPSMEALLAALCPPPRRRGTVPLVAAFVAATLGGAGLPSALQSPAPPPPSQAELTTRASNALTAALRPDELSGGVSPYVARELRRYVTRWARHQGALEHRALLRPGDPETSTRLACLADARDHATLVATGLHAAPAPGERAVELVEQLPAPETCIDMSIDRLTCRLRLAALDEAPAARQVVAGMRAALELEAAGDLPGALTRASTAAADAHDLDLPLLRGQAGYHHGRLLYLSGRGGEAIAALERARDAADPTGCVDLRSDIYSRMIKTAANYGGPAAASAEEWSRQHMSLAAATRDGGAHLGDAHNERGLLRLLRRGDPEGALADFTTAIEERDRQLAGGVSSDLADTHLNRGLALTRLGRFAEASAALATATAIRTAVFGPDHPLHWREQKARAELLADRGDLDAAESLLLMALARVEAGIGRDSVPAVRILMSLADVAKRRGDGARELAFAEDAAARGTGDALAPDERIEVQLNVLYLRGGPDAEAGARTLAAAAEADPRVSLETRAEIAVIQAALAYGDGEEQDRGRLALAARHADRALTLLTRAGVEPGATVLDRARKIRGVIAIQRDEYDLAIDTLEPLLLTPERFGMDPHERAQLLPGVVYAYLGRDLPGDRERGCQWLRTLRDGPAAPPDEDLRDLKKWCRLQ